MKRLEGKVCIITGAANGLGAATAQLFSQEGARTILTDIDLPAAQKVAKDIPNSIAIQHDVADETSWKNVVSHCMEYFCQLDVLINNAGIFHYAPLLETSVAQFQAVINVNQLGCFLGMKSVAAAIEQSNGGAIVNISSVQAFQGMKGAAGYTASKYAIHGLTKVAALELAEKKIRVNSVHPGTMNTTMLDDIFSRLPKDFPKEFILMGIPLQRVAEPVEVARLTLFLASDEASYCTGGEYLADGGLMAGPPV